LITEFKNKLDNKLLWKAQKKQNIGLQII
jgi:hypothetical protein